MEQPARLTEVLSQGTSQLTKCSRIKFFEQTTAKALKSVKGHVYCTPMVMSEVQESEFAESGAPSRQLQKLSRRSPMRLVRHGGTALASAAIVALGVVYVLAPSTETFAVSVHVNRTAPSSIAKNHEVVYGTAEGVNRSPIAGSRLVIVERESGGMVVVAKATANKEGVYREAGALAPRRYLLEVEIPVSQHTVFARKWLSLEPGFAYHVSTHITTNSVFTFFPVGSY